MVALVHPMEYTPGWSNALIVKRKGGILSDYLCSTLGCGMDGNVWGLAGGGCVDWESKGDV